MKYAKPSLPTSLRLYIEACRNDGVGQMDSMTMANAWKERMAARYGPKVWDQEVSRWLDWDQALTRCVKGRQFEWLLGVPVYSESDIKKAFEWEFGDWWPAWCVKAHLVHTAPCEFEDHEWRLTVGLNGTSLVCDNPCEDPRVFCDGSGRYIFPICQNVPDVDQLKFEVRVSPEWVYESPEDWWVELHVKN